MHALYILMSRHKPQCAPDPASSHPVIRRQPVLSDVWRARSQQPRAKAGGKVALGTCPSKLRVVKEGPR